MLLLSLLVASLFWMKLFSCSVASTFGALHLVKWIAPRGSVFVQQAPGNLSVVSFWRESGGSDSKSRRPDVIVCLGALYAAVLCPPKWACTAAATLVAPASAAPGPGPYVVVPVTAPCVGWAYRPRQNAPAIVYI